jgi:ribonuclease HII
MRARPDCHFEQELWRRSLALVAGVDEVGVGALAGPVIAAAVILAPDTIIDGVADSKLLSPKRRQALCAAIREAAIAVGIGQADVEEVDRINVYWAAMEARRRAVEDLAVVPAHVLVDGKRPIAGCRLGQTPVVDGDARSASIAAASIVAKVTRDGLMTEYARACPGYGFERHKGYATAAHLAALTRLGPLSLHRRSCAPVWRAGRLERQLKFWSDLRQKGQQPLERGRFFR